MKKESIHNGINYIGTKFGVLTILKLESTPPFNNKNAAKYLCKCDCGNEKVIRWTSLNAYTDTISCGCVRKKNLAKALRHEEGEAALQSLYTAYQISAARREVIFNLSKEEFKKLTSGNCEYCGNTPLSIKTGPRFNGNYIYNGIDRVDNNDGYNIFNCVPCCGTCNKMKLNFSLKYFKDHINKMYNHINKS